MNFKTKCHELGFTLQYQSKEECVRLERWLHDNISRDIHYTGDDEDRYINYLVQLKKYFDTFLAQLGQALDTPLIELDNQNKIEYAARNGYHYYIMNEVSKADPQLDKPNSDNMTALHLAAMFGHGHTVEALLEKGANPLLINDWNQYPIHNSLFLSDDNDDLNLIQKKIDLFKRLHQIAPETIYEPDRSGETVFHKMSVNDDFNELMNELLNTNTKGAFISNHHLHYPIHCSILNNQTKAVKRLLEIDKVAFLCDRDQEIAIHYAARSRNAEIIQACCEHTPDLNAQNLQGETPLIIAAQNKNLTAIKILVERGAHLHEEDMLGHSFIYYVKEKHARDIIDWLEKKDIREPVRPGI